MRKLFLLLILISSGSLVFAQNKDEELAAQYYSNGEFEKAADLYEKLLKKNPSSGYIYSNYLNSLVELRKYDEAGKMVRSQAKRFPANYTYRVDEGWILEKGGEPEKAQKLYLGLIKDLKSEEEAGSLAQAFARRNKYQSAIETFQKGRRLAGFEAAFSRELAMLYGQMGQIEDLIKECLNILEFAPEQMTEVQNLLQASFGSEKDWETLKKELNVRIQKSPDKLSNTEMMMWVLVQQKNFNAAFMQFRSVDKRMRENGRRVMDLGELSLANGDYDAAVKCYEYVASLGDDKPFYHRARFGLLDVRYKKITISGAYDSTDLVNAEADYLKFIEQNREYFQVDEAMYQLAELYNFYMHQNAKAMKLLEELISMPRVTPQFKARCKLDLGDAYLLSGDVWEAELLYSQVDKDFKEDALGQEAKFRMARLFFYKGEFDRSLAYLDVLKTATTQLISNDAIELGMLIQDNTGIDSTEQALNMFAHASLLIYRNQIQEGLQELKLIESIYPTHPLADEILFLKASAAIKTNNPSLAASYYEEIITRHGSDILGDNAMFRLAELYDKRLNEKEKARNYYEKLLLQYPGSLFVVEARKRFRELRGDKSDSPEKPQLYFNGFTN